MLNVNPIEILVDAMPTVEIVGDCVRYTFTVRSDGEDVPVLTVLFRAAKVYAIPAISIEQTLQ